MFDFNTNKPQRFFFCRIPVVLERCWSSWGKGQGVLFAPPAPSPHIRPWIISPHLIRITASGIFRLWNPKPRTLESEFQLKESTFHWQGIWNPVVGGGGGGYPDSKIIQCTGDTKPWSNIYNFLMLRAGFRQLEGNPEQSLYRQYIYRPALTPGEWF